MTHTCQLYKYFSKSGLIFCRKWCRDLGSLKSNFTISIQLLHFQNTIMHKICLDWSLILAEPYSLTTDDRSYTQAKAGPLNPTSTHRLLCMYCTHTYITHTLAHSSWQPSAHIKVGLLAEVLGGLHCWPHLPAPVQASFLCQVPWSGVSTASWVSEKSFSLCGQMRGSSQIALLMTFLLSLELLSLPKDNFPMMTKVSDFINFHLSEKCGSN